MTGSNVDEQIVLTLLVAAGDPGVSVPSLTNLLAPILSTGIVGIVLIMLIFEIGFITKKSADRERDALRLAHENEIKTKDEQLAQLKADIAELKQANGALQVLTQEKMIPALVQATEVSRAYVTELARRNDRHGD